MGVYMSVRSPWHPSVWGEEQLDRAGIPNRLESFQGGHGPVGPRAGEIMLPFFADVLDGR